MLRDEYVAEQNDKTEDMSTQRNHYPYGLNCVKFSDIKNKNNLYLMCKVGVWNNVVYLK